MEDGQEKGKVALNTEKPQQSSIAILWYQQIKI